MLTTKEFKTQYDLSDSAFKCLVAKIRSDRPELGELTRRIDGQAWEILHPETFHEYAAQRAEKTAQNAETDMHNAEFVEGVVPEVAELAVYEQTSSLSLGVQEVTPITVQRVDFGGMLQQFSTSVNNSNQGLDALTEQLAEQTKTAVVKGRLKGYMEGMNISDAALGKIAETVAQSLR